MFSLVEYWKNRQREDRKRQTSGLAAVVRDELTDEILQVNQQTDRELREVQDSLVTSKAQLQDAVDRERFVAMRMEKYRSMLQQQRERLTVDSKDDTDGTQEDGKSKEQMALADMTTTTTTTTTNAKYEEGQLTTGNDSQDDSDDNDDDDDDATVQDEPMPKPDFTPKERARLLEKLAKDEAALGKVEKSHQELVNSVRHLTKQVLVLEKKRADIRGLTDECKEFIVAAGEVEREADMIGHGDDDAGDDEEDVEMRQLWLEEATGNGQDEQDRRTTRLSRE